MRSKDENNGKWVAGLSNVFRSDLMWRTFLGTSGGLLVATAGVASSFWPQRSLRQTWNADVFEGED
eukprot:9134371-Pyramimonas_sp.AAC.1